MTSKTGLAQNKWLFAATMVAALGFFASPASASCTSTGIITCTTTDSTQIEAFKNTTFQSSYTGNGFSAGVGDVLQTQSESFDTDKMISTLTDHRGVTTLELKFYTSFDGSGLGAHYADIFLGGNPANKDSFGYAISLGDESGNGGPTTPGFYQVSSSSYKTSEQTWQGKGGIYGGEYKGLDGAWHYSPTVVTTAATKDARFTTTVNETTTNADPGFGYLVDVKLVASTTDFNALFGSGLSVFWGTADCSNDAIEAFVLNAPTHIPEPLTLSLFSAGLGGAAMLRRRSRKSKTA